MKTKILISLVCLFALLSGSCKRNKAATAEENINKDIAGLTFPQKINPTTTLTACYYRDKTLTFRNETSADTLAQINVDSLRKVTLHNLRTGLFPRQLILNVIDAGASIQYIYAHDKDSVMFSYTTEELK